MKTALARIIYFIGNALWWIMALGGLLLFAWMAFDAISRLGIAGLFNRVWPVCLGVIGIGLAVGIYTWAEEHLDNK